MSRRCPSVVLALAAFALSALSGCVHGVAPGGCTSDSDCEDGQMCIDATCVDGNSVDLGCETDFDCNVNAGERCVEGTCQVGSAAGGGTCMVTADCPMDQYCNSATGSCQALLQGWCRESAQCGGDATVCSSTTPAVPGRCVQCLTNVDCGDGYVCVQPGVCEASGETSPRPGDGTTDPGTGGGTDPGTGGTDPGTGGGTDPGTGGGTGDACADNGWYGDGVCDDFCPQPDPDCQGGTDPGTGGGTNPGVQGECVEMLDCWSAGYSFDYTCENGACVCDVAWMEGFVCAAGETVDTASCTCVGGGGGTGGTGDTCTDNGWYGDGVCDDFCPQPDPDCQGGGGGTGTGLGANASCVTGGQVQQCDAGLECIYASDANGNPSYGSCKQICSSDADCTGGLSCALGFLANGDGICGAALTEGQTGCGFWEEGDTFCFDASAPNGATDAFLECLNGTCGFICDYNGNTEAPWTCPNGGTCGASYATYDGYNVDLAVCQ